MTVQDYEPYIPRVSVDYAPPSSAALHAMPTAPSTTDLPAVPTRAFGSQRSGGSAGSPTASPDRAAPIVTDYEEPVVGATQIYMARRRLPTLPPSRLAAQGASQQGTSQPPSTAAPAPPSPAAPHKAAGAPSVAPHARPDPRPGHLGTAPAKGSEYSILDGATGRVSASSVADVAAGQYHRLQDGTRSASQVYVAPSPGAPLYEEPRVAS